MPHRLRSLPFVALFACGLGAQEAAQAPGAAKPFRPVSIIADEESTCVVGADGDVRCWGSDCHEAPHDGWANQVCSWPSRVPGAVNVKTFALGQDMGPDYVLQRDGSVWRMNRGPDRAIVRIDTPKAAGLANAGSFACATLDDGHVSCWDTATYGAGGVHFDAPPFTVEGLEDASSLSAGSDAMFALDRNGAAYAWSSQHQADKPVERTRVADTFRILVTGRDHRYIDLRRLVLDVSLRGWGGGKRFCGVFSTGGARCWGGDNSHGELGWTCSGACKTAIDDAPDLVLPRGMKASNIASFAMGLWHTCALLTDGEAVCWGDNGVGQLALQGVGRSDPALLPILAPIRALALGNGHTCALMKGGEVLCWGKNADGQLGRGSRTPPSADPEPVAF